jgi:hypothetical protein
MDLVSDHSRMTSRKINKASAGRLGPKIGILAISISPVMLQLFSMPSDYGVVLLWWEVLRHSPASGQGIP